MQTSGFKKHHLKVVLQTAVVFIWYGVECKQNQSVDFSQNIYPRGALPPHLSHNPHLTLQSHCKVSLVILQKLPASDFVWTCWKAFPPVIVWKVWTAGWCWGWNCFIACPIYFPIYFHLIISSLTFLWFYLWFHNLHVSGLIFFF